jgi:hypothetical protein
MTFVHGSQQWNICFSARVVCSFELTKRRRSECTTDLTHPERESVFSCLDCDHLRNAAARIMQLHTAHTMECLRTFSSYCRMRALASIWRNDTHTAAAGDVVRDREPLSGISTRAAYNFASRPNSLVICGCIHFTDVTQFRSTRQMWITLIAFKCSSTSLLYVFLIGRL